FNNFQESDYLLQSKSRKIFLSTWTFPKIQSQEIHLRGLYRNYPRGHVRISMKLFSNIFIYFLQLYMPKYKVFHREPEVPLGDLFWKCIMCKDAAEWEPKKNKKKKEQGDIMKKRRP